MKIIALGDTHGRAFWKYVVNTQEFDKIVFIGDYFDTRDSITGEQQLANFLDIIEYKKANPDKVVLLLGNHDHHYFKAIGDTGTSGYQATMAPSYSHVLEENKQYLQMAHNEGDILFSHAGVGESWLNNMVKLIPTSQDVLPLDNAKKIARFVNSLWKYRPLTFAFTGRNSSGDDMGQTPIWIRPRSLMKDCAEIMKKLLIQVVGHTVQNQIDIKGKATGGRYYFIDTLGTSGEYLIIEDGVFKTEKV